MIRSVICIVAGVLAFTAFADLREPPVTEAERVGIAEACEYYAARAEGARGRQGEFVVFLSNACDAAEKLLDSGSAKQQARSALLLTRIALLHQTVAGMNTERQQALAAKPYMPTTGYVPVTPSGEFLIAHRLGVLLAFDAWLDTGAQFSVASYP